MLTIPSPMQSLWDHLHHVEVPPAERVPVAPKRDGSFTNRDLYDLLMDGERFMAWLVRQGPKAYVGATRSTQGCPIAMYLMATVPGAVHVHMGDRYAQVYTTASPTGKVTMPLPGPVANFVHLVDRHSYGEPVPVDVAMKYCREAGWYPPRKGETR